MSLPAGWSDNRSVKRIEYTCSRCKRRGKSGELPRPPSLPIYPLPLGWTLVPDVDPSKDDDVHCNRCSPAPSSDDLPARGGT